MVILEQVLTIGCTDLNPRHVAFQNSERIACMQHVKFQFRVQVSSALAMSTQYGQSKVLEQCQISPPLSSVPTTSLPLTFMDVNWLACVPSQNVFMYQVPLSTAQFTGKILPVLKKSLSLTLQRFFPMCGNLICPPKPTEPYILYEDGDSVPLLVVESTGAFSDFLSQGPRDAKEIHVLILPPLPTRVLPDTLDESTPLLAIQITLFPNSGLSIGITNRHVVADGMSVFRFLSTWASISKANCDMSSVSISLPVHDKSIIQDPNGMKKVLLDNWRARGSPTWKENVKLVDDNVRASFTFSRTDIERLKKWISTKYENETKKKPDLHLSSYVVTCSFIWVCLIKSLNVIHAVDSSKDEDLCHFLVVGDYRRMDDLGIPVTYFGNCLGGHIVSITRGIFGKDDSVVKVAEAISRGVLSFKDRGISGHADRASKVVKLLASGGIILTIAGSPKLNKYDTDFGWGRPEKVEAVHTDISGSVSLFESRNEKGGIGFGFCRSRHYIDVFTSLFQHGMNQFL